VLGGAQALDVRSATFEDERTGFEIAYRVGGGMQTLHETMRSEMVSRRYFPTIDKWAVNAGVIEADTDRYVFHVRESAESDEHVDYRISILLKQ
jgi:hypothetical protein